MYRFAYLRREIDEKFRKFYWKKICEHNLSLEEFLTLGISEFGKRLVVLKRIKCFRKL